jgi:hypothetical protein
MKCLAIIDFAEGAGWSAVRGAHEPLKASWALLAADVLREAHENVAAERSLPTRGR